MAIGFAIYVFFDFVVPSWTGRTYAKASVRARWLPVVSSFIILLLLLFAAAQTHAPRVIPVIAYVVILLMVIFWTLAGVAFFADYYRLPVFTLAVAIVLALNHWPVEHVFPAEPLSASDRKPLHDPAYFVSRTAGAANVQPVVIITATGGGIHAAAWTATVLRALNKEFGDLQLHKHILLMSTVSGGSVATAGFLREYFTGQPFNDNSYNRIQGAAACSSLQAVAWGLAYPDTQRLFFPWFFNIFPALDRFDRGWALQKAIDRNLHDPECINDEGSREAGAPNPLQPHSERTLPTGPEESPMRRPQGRLSVFPCPILSPSPTAEAMPICLCSPPRVSPPASPTSRLPPACPSRNPREPNKTPTTSSTAGTTTTTEPILPSSSSRQRPLPSHPSTPFASCLSKSATQTTSTSATARTPTGTRLDSNGTAVPGINRPKAKSVSAHSTSSLLRPRRRFTQVSAP